MTHALVHPFPFRGKIAHSLVRYILLVRRITHSTFSYCCWLDLFQEKATPHV